MDNIGRKTIGIIGGAGPMAGFLLGQKIIDYCQKEYNCVRDADFPRIILLSEPFAEMLRPQTEQQDDAAVSKQLHNAMEFLLNSGVSQFAIACNTLHGFLDHTYTKKFVSLIEETKQYITKQQFKRVLILATKTSSSKSVYDFSGGCWPSLHDQMQVDRIIDKILSGDVSSGLKEELQNRVQSIIHNDHKIDSVLLGCTELSLILNGMPKHYLGVYAVDPVEIVAQRLCMN